MSRAFVRRVRFVSLALLALPACAGDLGDDGLGAEAADLGAAQQLVRAGSEKCLDVAAAGTANGTRLQQWTCNGTSAQAFAVDERGGGVVRLLNTGSGKCAQVRAGGTANGTELQLWTCGTTSAQRFRVEGLGGGWARVVHVKSGKCVDVDSASAADGARVQLWTCNGTDAQRWRLAIQDGDDGDGGGGGGLVWRTANLTNFTSYPAPGSEECEDYNGCTWAGYFAFVDGKMPETWVMQHNIAAVHEKDAGAYALKTLRLRQNGREIDVTVYDMCSDSDCDGCCTRNSQQTGFLVDIEKYTMARFGSGYGIVEWACLDCP